GCGAGGGVAAVVEAVFTGVGGRGREEDPVVEVHELDLLGRAQAGVEGVGLAVVHAHGRELGEGADGDVAAAVDHDRRLFDPLGRQVGGGVGRGLGEGAARGDVPDG